MNFELNDSFLTGFLCCVVLNCLYAFFTGFFCRMWRDLRKKGPCPRCSGTYFIDVLVNPTWPCPDCNGGDEPKKGGRNEG